jgi:hypothetical protein
MACKRNDICFKVCLMITIVPGQGVTSVIRCGDECGTSPRIDVTSSGINYNYFTINSMFLNYIK